MALHLSLKHTARPDISSLQRDQIIPGESFSHPSEQTVGLPQPGPVDCIPDRAGVGEKRQLTPTGDVLLKRFLGLRAKSVVLSLQQQFCNRQKLAVAVVRDCLLYTSDAADD